MAVATAVQERTFDWFGSERARFGLRVTLNGTASRDPEGRGLLLIDRQGHVVDASGYARYVGGRRAWVEARVESPVIDIHVLEGRWVGKVALNLDPGDGGFADADLKARGLVVTQRRKRLDGQERLYSQCLRCGAWGTVRDADGQPSLMERHVHALCGGCRRALPRLGERPYGRGYGPVWRQCPRCTGWYRSREDARWNETCYGCRRRGGEVDEDEMEELLGG